MTLASIKRWKANWKRRRAVCTVCGERMKFVGRDELNGGKWYRCGCTLKWSNQ
jgi:hypothetical protein